jgi:hypothetical protein
MGKEGGKNDGNGDVECQDLYVSDFGKAGMDINW